MATGGNRRIKGLGEVALRVADLPRMQAFYEEVVGLELIRSFPGASFLRIADGVEGHTEVVALFDRSSDAGHVPPQGRASTLDHFAFVTTPEELDAEHERLEGLGLEIETAVHEWTQWRSIYVRDPEGNLVEWVCHDPSISG
jgi:catechol 2,3-dioxygenase-like lactoylglutathione lyase family enzyme